MKTKQQMDRDELRPEYNFDYSKALRGKYYKRLLKEGSNVVILEADVAKAFGDSSAVNEALRSLLNLTSDSAPNKALKRTRLKAPLHLAGR